MIIENGFSIWEPLGRANTEKVTQANINEMSQTVLKYQEDKAKEILSCCVPRNAMTGARKVGLVVGKVQSGKTTSFTYLTSLAADNGYKIIIHLLGTTTNLKEDNALAVKEILCTDDNDNYWRAINVKTGENIKPSSEGLEQILFENNDPDLDFLPEQQETVIYFYLLKNHAVIKHLSKYLSEYHNNLSGDNRGPLPVLIVDDEVDSFSPDASREDKDATRTHKELKSLYDSCPIVSYVGYTATSQAIAYAEKDNFLNPDFICTLNPGIGYDGNVELFGTRLDRIYTGQSNNTKFIKKIDIGEDINGEEVEQDRIDSLCEAIRFYLVSSILYFGRNLKRNHTSMVVHGDLKVDIHRQDREIVKSYLEKLKDQFDQDEENGNADISTNSFKYIYDELFYEEENDQIDFSTLLKRINALINNNMIRTVVVNADKSIGNEHIPEIVWEDSRLWIVIGGHGLSRGYVVSGLITTWMPRQANKITADTIEQLGRFFGYHVGYKDLIRIFLKEKSIEAYKAYDIFEKSVWNGLEACISDGAKLSETTLQLELPNELHHPTSNLKMKRDESKNNFTWASSGFSPFLIKDASIEQNHDFHSIINKYVNNLETSHDMLKISNDAYKDLFVDYTGNQKYINVYKVAENQSMSDVLTSLISPLLDFISDNDENLKLMIDRMKNDTSEKCDIVFIKHPGQNGGQSKRGVSIDDKTAEYNLTYVQQGPNDQTSFKGDKKVVINESNYQIQIICYEQISINKVVHDSIKNIRVLSIMRPYGVETKTITLI
jgi:hypothetical protein